MTSSYNEHLWNEVVHINFHGAARDQLVDQNLANFDRFSHNNESLPLRYALDVKSSAMKNVYQHMDHNSLFYYKYFLDAAIPAIVKVSLMNSKPAKERFEMAQSLLTFSE